MAYLSVQTSKDLDLTDDAHHASIGGPNSEHLGAAGSIWAVLEKRRVSRSCSAHSAVPSKYMILSFGSAVLHIENKGQRLKCQTVRSSGQAR